MTLTFKSMNKNQRKALKEHAFTLLKASGKRSITCPVCKAGQYKEGLDITSCSNTSCPLFNPAAYEYCRKCGSTRITCSC